MARRVVIVGAGLTGPLLACYLARAGWRVALYERRGDPRQVGLIGGRSINLALSARGLAGLAGVGLDQVALARAIRMPGRMIHPVSGPVVFQPYSANPQDAIHSISRAELHLLLVQAAAAHENVSLHFEHECVDVDLGGPAAVFRSPQGMVRAEGDLVVGADGAYSAVRTRFLRVDRFDYSQSYLAHGYKELRIPPAEALGPGVSSRDGFAMEPHALHIWPRGGAMMIALPNPDRSFTCTLFWPYAGPGGLETLRTPASILDHFRREYPDAVPLMPTLVEDYLQHPTGSLVTVRCWPWHVNGRVLLIGDAAHAIVPFYGQGMNAAFEDCRLLMEVLGRHGDDVPAALDEFQAARKPNTDAIADMALENFIEMRDKVASPAFQYRKRLEQHVHALVPDVLTPQYNLVSFSTVPYVEARRQGRRMERVLDALVARIPAEEAGRLSEREWSERVEREVRFLLRTQGSVVAECEGGAHGGEVLYDISPPLVPAVAVWPGDTPLRRRLVSALEDGASVTVSAIEATVHLGAHADAPSHYARGAPGIGERPLGYYIGPCQVVDARVARGARVRPEDIVGGLEGIRQKRVLVRTGTFPDPQRWVPDFAGLSVELVEALARRGVVTIGVDTPSVDLQDSRDLPAHQAAWRYDMAILEGLVLAGVPAGEYEMVALPLRLMGFDASPVRAVLRALPAVSET